MASPHPGPLLEQLSALCLQEHNCQLCCEHLTLQHRHWMYRRWVPRDRTGNSLVLHPLSGQELHRSACIILQLYLPSKGVKCIENQTTAQWSSWLAGSSPLRLSTAQREAEKEGHGVSPLAQHASLQVRFWLHLPLGKMQ